MKNLFTNFILLSSLVITFAYCNNSESKKADQATVSHKIWTNERAVNNSLIDSTLLAPDFSRPAMNGEEFRLSEHRGKIIVLNLWATYCGPCVKEIPDFISLQKEFRDKDVEFIGISLDEKGWEVVRPFAKKYGVNYRILLDKKESILDKYPISGLPNTYIINKQGEIAHVIISMTTKELLKPLLTQLTKIEA